MIRLLFVFFIVYGFEKVEAQKKSRTWVIYSIDDKGQQKKYVETREKFNSQDKIIRSITEMYENDRPFDKQLIKIKFFPNGDEKMQITITRTQGRKMKKIKHFAPTSANKESWFNENARTFHYYNEHGDISIVETIVFGITEYVTTYEYDSMKRLIRTHYQYLKNNTPMSLEEIEYKDDLKLKIVRTQSIYIADSIKHEIAIHYQDDLDRTYKIENPLTNTYSLLYYNERGDFIGMKGYNQNHQLESFHQTKIKYRKRKNVRNPGLSYQSTGIDIHSRT